MDRDSVSTRRELIKLTSAGALAGLTSLTPSQPDCEDVNIYLEENDFSTALGQRYELNMEGADEKVEIYEEGEKVDEYRPGDTFILTSGEYSLETEVEGCTYTEEVRVE